ncbi:MAG: lipoyl(octanoyl) transferase LipB, partial [Bdellovibrionota bacterium]|nr:lipoyl(octanoyl) transferase LipB [Bdellovibrionota bacterium]
TERLNNSSLPLHTIKRGGGMTFHHPDQIVIYPILSVTKAKLSALELIDKLFRSVAHCVKSLYNIDLKVRHDLLGLWHEDKKICSMGIELKRFISKHGLALNVEIQDEYREKMKGLNPCGLSFDRYLSLKEISSRVNKEELINKVKQAIIDEFK